MRIALTQSEGRLAGLAEALSARGREVVRQPLIRTQPLVSEEVKSQAERLLNCSWLLFTSSKAVEAWDALGLPFKNIDPKIGVVGETTAQAVRSFGGNVVLSGKPQNAEGLADLFLQREVRGIVGLPRGNRALGTLQERLEAHSIKTSAVTIYKTVMRDWTVGEVDAVVLASPSAVKALPEEVGKRVKLVSIGPSTSREIARRGWHYVQAETPDADAILRTLEPFEPEHEQEVA